MKKKCLLGHFPESRARAETEEGREKLLAEIEQREKAAQKALRAKSQTPGAPIPEGGESAQTAPEPAEVRSETRPDPILPVMQVREHPAREAGRRLLGSSRTGSLSRPSFPSSPGRVSRPGVRVSPSGDGPSAAARPLPARRGVPAGRERWHGTCTSSGPGAPVPPRRDGRDS